MGITLQSAQSLSSSKVPRALWETQITIFGDIFQRHYYADKVLEYHFKSNRKLGSRDRKFLAETTYEIVRWLSRLNGLVDLINPQLPDLARMESLVLVQWKLEGKTLGDLPLISKEAMELRDRLLKMNNLEALQAKLQPWEKLAYPQWLYEELGGEKQKDLLESLNSQAALILRANTLKANLEQVKKSLEEEGFGSEESKLSSLGLVMKERKNVFGTKTFKSGFFEVQDEGSQKIAPFLEVKPGQRVVDACAGAGGKTLHLAALMENKGMLVALDNHPKKLAQLKLRARRAGVSNLRSQLVDSSKVVKRLEGSFDRVLLDVPCSGTGVLRRNPDSKWKLSPEEVERLVKLQAQILEDYSKMCKPGGKLVYATCSLLSRENEEQINQFLEKHPGVWKRDTADLRLSPQSAGCDGFFAARLLRI